MSKFTDLALDRVLGLNKSIVIVRKIGRFWPSDVRSVFEQSSEDDQVLYSFFSKFVDYGKGRKGILLDLARAVTERMEYVDDQANYGKGEFWNNPIGVFNRTKDDCFIKEEKLLTSDGDLISMESLEVNDEIIGANGRPTTVIRKSYKGIKKTLKFHLNNGSVIEVTPEHTFSVSKNKVKTTGQKWVDKKASELQIGDQLEYCKDIQFVGKFFLGYDLGYFFGLYLADGWIKNKNAIYIAGKDGFKKENQKEWVRNFCEKRGIPFFMRKRYCYLHSDELVNQIHSYFGRSGAKNKKIREHSFDLEGTKGLLDGLKADASERENELTYSTINKSIAIAIRIWLRRIGKQCSISLLINHGGFGRNPIYRIGVRRKRPRRIIVKSIEEGGEKETYNITTTSGKVYLPEQDTIIRQCDGFAVLICYLARLFGFAPWEVFVWVGQVDTGDGLVGHACVCFYDVGKNEYFPIEGSFFASESWDNFGKVSLSDNVRYYYTDYIFNDLVSFSVRKLVKFDI